MTKDQAIAPMPVGTMREALLILGVDEQPPDCRTCEFANIMYDGEQCNKCLNGDKYQPAPAVVLWRTV
jgi:hypothetical protein